MKISNNDDSDDVTADSINGSINSNSDSSSGGSSTNNIKEEDTSEHASMVVSTRSITPSRKISNDFKFDMKPFEKEYDMIILKLEIQHCFEYIRSEINVQNLNESHSHNSQSGGDGNDSDDGHNDHTIDVDSTLFTSFQYVIFGHIFNGCLLFLLFMLPF